MLTFSVVANNCRGQHGGGERDPSFDNRGGALSSYRLPPATCSWFSQAAHIEFNLTRSCVCSKDSFRSL